MAIKLKILSAKLKTIEPENLAGSEHVTITEPVSMERKKRKLTAASLKKDADHVQIEQAVKELLENSGAAISHKKTTGTGEKNPVPVQKSRKAPKVKTEKPKEEWKDEGTQAIGTPKEVYIHDYSEKSFAVFGNTKPIKERLKELGGKFNRHLHPFRTDNDVPGWIFPLKARADVERIIY